MKCWFLTLALLLPAHSHAADIQGKWGISAPIFASRSDGGYSLFHAKSNRTVWAFDLSMRFRDRLNGDEKISSLGNSAGDGFAIAGGPRYRSYRRPDEDFSFYLDRYLSGAYSNFKYPALVGSTAYKQWSVGAGLGIGCEYFAPRFHFGVAIHADLGRLRYGEDSSKTSVPPFQQVLGSAVEADFSISPAIVLRGYF